MSSPMQIWLFFTDTSEFWSRGIRFATGGDWSHVGIGFDLEDGRREYFEALFDGGFSGPSKPSKLAAFVARNPDNHCCVVPLPRSVYKYDDSFVIQTHEICKQWADGDTKRGYAKWQLASMLLFERFCMPVPKSENKVVCSEAVSRLLESIIDLRDERHITHDTVSPASAFRRLMSDLAGYGDFTRLIDRQQASAPELFLDNVPPVAL
jgi:hypothetical protein